MKPTKDSVWNIGTEPAREESNPEGERMVSAWVWTSGEWRIEGSSPYAWKERGQFKVVPIISAAEVKLRIEAIS